MADDTDTTQTSQTSQTQTVTKTVVQQETLTVEEQKVSKILRIAGMFWDWFDQRDVEKHIVAAFTLFMTFMELRWGMSYAEKETARQGTEIAAVLAAVGVPITALQGVVINWYFTARQATVAAEQGAK